MLQQQCYTCYNIRCCLVAYLFQIDLNELVKKLKTLPVSGKAQEQVEIGYLVKNMLGNVGKMRTYLTCEIEKLK